MIIIIIPKLDYDREGYGHPGAFPRDGDITARKLQVECFSRVEKMPISVAARNMTCSFK